MTIQRVLAIGFLWSFSLAVVAGCSGDDEGSGTITPVGSAGANAAGGARKTTTLAVGAVGARSDSGAANGGTSAASGSSHSGGDALSTASLGSGAGRPNHDTVATGGVGWVSQSDTLGGAGNRAGTNTADLGGTHTTLPMGSGGINLESSLGGFAGTSAYAGAPGHDGGSNGAPLDCQPNSCGEHAVCVLALDGRTPICQCTKGYQGDGTICKDIDGCADHPCYAGVKCSDLEAPEIGYVCGACPAGMQGDGRMCTDVNECSDPSSNDCSDNATCTNLDGGQGFRCECMLGYVGNGVSCIITSCTTLTLQQGIVACPDGANAGRTCHFSCQAGYALMGDASRTCGADGTWSGVRASCENIDECTAGIDDCDPNAGCMDTNGGFDCACRTGWSGDGESCVDLDGCAAAPCFPGVTCIDAPAPALGSSCGPCPNGYTGDGRVCTDLDECASPSTNTCAPTATCENLPNGQGFRCTCQPGFVGDGKQCQDLNECQSSPSGSCDENATCTNIDNGGGYLCECNAGFVGNGRSCVKDQCIRYVNANSSAAEPTGTSWQDAFARLQAGIDSAAAAVQSSCPGGVEVWVAQGTYHPQGNHTGSDPVLDTFVLKDQVSLYGGFLATEASRSDRDWVARETVLSGIAPDPTAVQVHGVVSCKLASGCGDDAVLDGFTITGGKSAWESGGITTNASLTVRNSLIVDNTVDSGGGGGMLIESASPLLENVVFRGNATLDRPKAKNGTNRVGYGGSDAGNGGALLVEEGSPTLIDCLFEGNRTGKGGDGGNGGSSLGEGRAGGMGGDGGRGGAIYANGGQLTLVRTAFRNNAAGAGGRGGAGGSPDGTNSAGGKAGVGGAVGVLNGRLAMIDCELSNNRSGDGGTAVCTESCPGPRPGGDGGGLWASGSEVQISRSRFMGNSTGVSPLAAGDACTYLGDANGGAIWAQGLVTVTDSLFKGNIVTETRDKGAAGNGGAIYAGQVEATNCVFIANHAGDATECGYGGSGGAIVAGSVSITNCTFVNNQAGRGALPDASLDGEGGAMDVGTATIKNSIFWGNFASDGLQFRYNYADVTFSDVQFGFLGEGNIDLSPRFVSLAGEALELEANSPCVDRGTYIGAPPADLSGVTRGDDGDASNNLGLGPPWVDMGAYEYHPL